MKVLFDQGTPVALRHYLDEHEVATLKEKGWSEKGNDEMLDPAELEGYEFLVPPTNTFAISRIFQREI